MNVNRKICMSFGNTRFMLIDNNLMHNVLDIEKTIILSFLLALLILDGLYLQCNVIQCGLSYNVVILNVGISIASSSYLLVKRKGVFTKLLCCANVAFHNLLKNK